MAKNTTKGTKTSKAIDQAAATANAPTGPVNMGKPGSNVPKEEMQRLMDAAKLSDALKADAEVQGETLGAFASYRVEAQYAMCDATLTMLGMGHEKYVANVTPGQEAYVMAVVRAAWERTYPGTELVISQDQCLANFASAARNIARAASLDGWIKNAKGDAIAIRAKLETMLKARVNAKDRFDKGNGEGKGFWAAAKESARILRDAKEVNRTDAALRAASFGKLDTKTSKRGRPQQAPSDEYIGNFLAKLPLAAPSKVADVIEASVRTLAGAIPLTSTDPKAKAACHAVHDWMMREGLAFASKAREQYRKALATLQSPAKQGEGQQGASPAQLARVDAAETKSGTVGPMQTPKDDTAHDATVAKQLKHDTQGAEDLTAKRKQRRKAPAAAVADSTPAKAA